MNSLLAITYAFFISYCPYHAIGMGKNADYYRSPTHVEFELGATLFDCVNVYAGEETFQVSDGTILSWLPYSQSYWLGLEYEKSFNDVLIVNAGVKHKCQHPMNCADRQLSNYNSAVTELYIKLSGKIPLF